MNLSRANKYLWALLILVVGAAGYGAFELFQYVQFRTEYERIQPAENEGISEPQSRSLPQDTVVRDTASLENPPEPFAVRPKRGALDGTALTVPAGNKEKEGRISFNVDVPSAQKYYAWTRVLWTDACSNSFFLTLDDFPQFTVGENRLFNRWHWVKAGSYDIPEAGEHQVQIIKREDGVWIDQLLLTPSKDYRPPEGPLRQEGNADRTTRFFTDDFGRSPGHGLSPWKQISGEWNIVFSFDPNRVPRQYSVKGQSGDADEGMLVLDKPPWDGSRMAFNVSVPEKTTFGAVLHYKDHQPDDSLNVAFDVAGDGADQLRITGEGVDITENLSMTFEPDQWYRIKLRRWGRFLSVRVDDETIYRTAALEPGIGRPALTVQQGQAFFDDVGVSEIVSYDVQANGSPLRLTADSAEATWYRASSENAEPRLIGRNGTVTAGPFQLPVREMMVQSQDASKKFPHLFSREWRSTVISDTESPSQLFMRRRTDTSAPHTVTLRASENGVRLGNLAIATGERRRKAAHWGPYDFSDKKRADPSDYLDFTDEEYQRIKNSDKKNKLKRKMQYRSILGHGGKAFWRPYGKGKWRIQNGALIGIGPDTYVNHWRQTNCDVAVRMRLKLMAADTLAGVGLYRDNQGENVPILATASPEKVDEEKRAGPGLILELPATGEWFNIRVVARGERIAGYVDGEEVASGRYERGIGRKLTLVTARGKAAFDNVDMRVFRRGHNQFHYEFDRQETDWLRRGGKWHDHAGIACMLASSWISLIAPDKEGTLWNKRTFDADGLMATVNIQANTEWFGWDKKHSHRHHPYDNIRIMLTTAREKDSGYRLEVNARDRSQTVLFRNGKEVASVKQDDDFPIRYKGGHIPYRPRSSHFSLIRTDDKIIARVNGENVLTFEDLEPLDVKHVGVGAYNTRMNIGQIEIRTGLD